MKQTLPHSAPFGQTFHPGASIVADDVADKCHARLDRDPIERLMHLLGIDPATAWMQTYREKEVAYPDDVLGRASAYDFRLATSDHDQGLAFAIWPHESTGKGRKRSDIAKGMVERFYLDDLSLAVAMGLNEKVGVAAIVETSPDNHHAWVKLPFPVTVDKGAEIQKALRWKFGGDPLACKIDQVARWPGSWNRKAELDEAFQVRITWGKGEPSNADAIAAIVAEYIAQASQKAAGEVSALTVPKTAKAIRRIEAASVVAPRDQQAMYESLCSQAAIVVQSRSEWRALGAAFKFVDSGTGWSFELWHDISARSPGYVDRADCLKAWAKLQPSNTEAGPIWKHAKRSGVDTRTFSRQWVAIAKRTYVFDADMHPEIKRGRFSAIANARFGTITYLNLSYEAREVHRVLHLFHGGADNGQVRFFIRFLVDMCGKGFNKKVVKRALAELVAAGLLSIKRNPGCEFDFAELHDVGTGYDGTGYTVPAKFDWAAQPRSEGVEFDHGVMVAPMDRDGFTKLEKTMMTSALWRSLDVAMRELITLVIARSYKGGVAPCSENFISASTGIPRQYVNEIIPRLVTMKVLDWKVRGRRFVFYTHHHLEVVANWESELAG
jgi:hypothetical protein